MHGFKHLRRIWLGGACCGVSKEGPLGWRSCLAAGVHPASGSGAGFVQQTASGSALGPVQTHTGHLAQGSHRLDADLGTHTSILSKERGGKSDVDHICHIIIGLFVSFLSELDTFIECQSIRKHFTDKNPAVSLAVYVSCYCKTW